MTGRGAIVGCATLLTLVGGRAFAAPPVGAEVDARAVATSSQATTGVGTSTRASSSAVDAPSAHEDAAAAPGAAAPPPAAVAPEPAVAETPRPAPDAYAPLIQLDVLGARLEIPILLALRGEGVSSFPVDRDGNGYQTGLAASPVLRLGLHLAVPEPFGEYTAIVAEYEQDLPTGTWTGDAPVSGRELPNATTLETQLRKGWARVSFGPVHVGGGFMTSHWGLGLVANDGAHGWEPGSARFLDPRGGDLVLRGFVSSGPLTDARLLVSVAFDRVRQDDVLVDGDTAYQLAASALLGHDRPTQAGVFVVHRRQTTADERYLHATLVDLTGRTTMKLGDADLSLEAEAVLTLGETSLGASPELPDHDLLQLGAAVRATLAFSSVGAVLDLIYASGEPNTHDARATGFHADPNFETGLLLFRYVQAAQTGRGHGTAADPQLVGAPPAGIERWPSRGGLTNALVVFPRLWVRPLDGLEAYGGVLIAIAPETNIDPFNTDLAGGPTRNALNLDPGGYWGTEVDLGVRHRLHLASAELTLGAEAGVLVPGSAIGDDTPVYGARLMASCRL